MTWEIVTKEGRYFTTGTRDHIRTMHDEYVRGKLATGKPLSAIMFAYRPVTMHQRIPFTSSNQFG